MSKEHNDGDKEKYTKQILGLLHYNSWNMFFSRHIFYWQSLDKITHPSVQELYNSIYTVYTEFGMLIFPVLILQTFSGDYKNKNILFYKLMGYNWLRYFLEKLLINFLFISIPTIIGLIIVSTIWYVLAFAA